MVVFNFRLHLFNLCLFLLLFCFQFPSFFFFLFFSRFCAPHYMCYSWIIYVSASHDSWPKNNSFSLFLYFFLFFAVFAVYRTLIWIEIDTEFGWTYHRTELDVDLRRQSPDWSPVGGNKANEGVAQLSWMSVTDHREVSVWFEDLQIFRLSYLSLSLSLTHSFLVNEEIECVWCLSRHCKVLSKCRRALSPAEMSESWVAKNRALFVFLRASQK